MAKFIVARLTSGRHQIHRVQGVTDGVTIPECRVLEVLRRSKRAADVLEKSWTQSGPIADTIALVEADDLRQGERSQDELEVFTERFHICSCCDGVRGDVPADIREACERKPLPPRPVSLDEPKPEAGKRVSRGQYDDTDPDVLRQLLASTGDPREKKRIRSALRAKGVTGGTRGN